MSKTCIIVSPYFPPSTLAGVHRARHLAKHLPAVGWTPIVLCVDEAYHEERLDPLLASLVPQVTEVVKVSAISARLTRPLGIGEISLRGLLPLRHNLILLLQKRAVDAVLITGSPYYQMLFAGEVKHRFGVPVLLDFQDPWVSAWAATQRKWSKAGLSHSLAKAMEPMALRAASFVTSVSETQNAQMAERYPWLDRTRMAAIPIGSDPEDFNAIADISGGPQSPELDPGRIHLSYVGTVWPAVMPTIRTFLRAVAALRTGSPDLYRRLRLNFVGTSANPNDVAGFRVLPLAEAEGVAEIVREIPQRIPYVEALSVLSRSNATLMLGSDEPHYTASKIYPYLMSRKPFLSIFHLASSAHQILLQAGGGIALGFSSREDLDRMEAAICEGLCRLTTDPKELGTPDPAVYMPYEARAIAGRFAEILEGLVRGRKMS